MSDNRHDSNQPRLARAPRGALRGLRPQAPPATSARRPVRRNPVSCSAVSRLCELARGDVFFHELLELRGLVVGALAVTALVDVFEELSAFRLVAEVVEEEV